MLIINQSRWSTCAQLVDRSTHDWWVVWVVIENDNYANQYIRITLEIVDD